MNKLILNTGVQEFILKNLNADIVSVLLKKPIFDAISNKELTQQIEAKKKCKKKLPTWFNTPKIYYPKKLNVEQTSSEITASYKTQIVSGKSLADLTGGFGIDSYFFSKKLDAVSYNEIDQNLAEIAAHNFKILGAKNIKISTTDAMAFLKQPNQHFDWVYLDPSRRNYKKSKVFMLEDCVPDITNNLELLFMQTNYALLKTAPLLDITKGLKSLKYAKEIHVVAVNNEVKELLWVLEKDFKNDILAKTVNFTKTGQQNFDFKITDEKTIISTYEYPQKYLYEPNAAILKSGAFKIIGHSLGLNKLGKHTHLYTSQQLKEFPGRRFKIDKVIPFTKNSFKKLQIKKANIATRNFPLSVTSIRKKFKINDGGGTFLFFLKNKADKYQVLVCSKI